MLPPCQRAAANPVLRLPKVGLAKNPSSLVLHLLSAAYYQEEKEWETLLQVSESGLSIVGRMETEIGRPLAR
jgi:hypothetical protein